MTLETPNNNVRTYNQQVESARKDVAAGNTAGITPQKYPDIEADHLKNFQISSLRVIFEEFLPNLKLVSSKRESLSGIASYLVKLVNQAAEIAATLPLEPEAAKFVDIITLSPDDIALISFNIAWGNKDFFDPEKNYNMRNFPPEMVERMQNAARQSELAFVSNLRRPGF
ncbi:MAG: hypothetical protein UX91_C0006G0096 [Candidatus Amesbacteria bacterium GW2011_GWB1_47_19]|nr:MAG: hypothetical protein UW51_C0002G0097 [Candidatus Amesbacteria bacterium GW2011_GWA1_44_24]KKU31313.1 MAG: hypothetical protein UX46_C0006G0105 [Candidatus Amesbacteria bacterium GW2011_GWC1_46_24]KKU67034.1 MAG: hypothetical protein UX91_C0006G0096 [Candidatus Amesbacteria bacterium GW2011_GWB1_47_19]OGD04974.1 MAG: hypothetical protein A2379_04335 [Candidatus Amesbacteria bacterium RIFOXYB1_FULL_47_13]HBC72748.1 hypothetical protein [Candidatus Amesbacteria bacterium]